MTTSRLVALALLAGCASANQRDTDPRAPVVLELVNERLDRTRITVMRRNGAIVTRRRLLPLSRETVRVRLETHRDLVFVAHDEGFNRLLDQSHVIDVRPGDRYTVTVTMMDAVAVLRETR